MTQAENLSSAMGGRNVLLFVVAVFAVLFLQAACEPKEKQNFNKVVRDAWDVVQCENRALRRRLERGIDRTVTSFTELEPGILEANVRPLGDLAEEIGAPSRIINWIRTIARETNVSAGVSQILKSGLARKKKLECPFVEPTDCSATEKYRRVDGRCNNLQNPLWGASFTPMARDLPAEYDSGEVHGYVRDDLPRQTGKHSALPSARRVSNVVHSSTSLPANSPLVTMALTFYGQYLAHDVTDTAFESGAEGSNLGCDCTDSVRGCAGIEIPKVDFFQSFDRKCLGFSRSKEVTSLDCEGGREQLNMMSSFVDVGNLYGQTEEVLLGLRGEDGKLDSSHPNFLPRSPHPNLFARSQNINFFTSGDERVSEVIGLTGITTIMLRLHNSIAERLATFGSYSNIEGRSDAIFEEARKITTAINQHITYNEFLNLTVGPAAMTKFGLESQSNGYFTGYDSAVNPTMTNEVIVSAQRFGHSLLQSIMSILAEDFTPATSPLQLRRIFWKPNFYLLFEDGFQRGVVTDSAEVCDRLVNDEVRNHLFETEDGNGEDLISRNIQRGRDHGVPSYNTVRASLGLSTATTFTSGGATGFEHLTDDVVHKLAQVYGHPDDVDLFTGGISETPVTDGVVGPLFSELLGRQFQRLKVGDRFWYENEEHGFTQAQLNEIRKVSLARLMCDHIDGIDSIQPQAMRLPDSSNQRVACTSLPSVDLSLWE